VSARDLMSTSLQVAVPLWIEEVRGWTVERRVATARESADVVASKGDVLQFGGKKGEAAEAFNALARGLACCAYQPGGITFLGDHYEVEVS
jgi:hypothetical protein